MSLQVLAVAPLLAGFAAVGPWLVPALFGQQWKSVLVVYPFIALSYAVNAIFSMPTSVLYVQGRNWSATVSHIVHILLFAGGSLILVPRLGLLGYGLAEVVAMASYAVIHVQVIRIFSFSYASALPWLLGFAPSFFAPFLTYPWFLITWLLALITMLLPKQRQQIRQYMGHFRWRKT